MSDAPPPAADQPAPMRRPTRWLAFFHGTFYLATGLWPLIHMSSFLWVTGPKAELWLVRCVGLLVAAIGAGLVAGAMRRRLALETVIIAVGAAAFLAAIDVYYVAVSRIPPIYLADAVVEIALVLGWIACISSERRSIGRSLP